MRITIIAAMDRNRLIGRGNGLPWKLPADLRHFRDTTMGHHLIMGRRTFDTLGGRPLPGRTIVVVTGRDALGADFATPARSLEEAIASCKGAGEVFVAGGARIYALALPVASRMILTRIDAVFEGDTWFPAWDESVWTMVSRERHEPDGKNLWPWAFETWQRNEAARG